MCPTQHIVFLSFLTVKKFPQYDESLRVDYETLARKDLDKSKEEELVIDNVLKYMNYPYSQQFNSQGNGYGGRINAIARI